METKALRKTYQIKVTLKGSKPPIWRRLLVASSITLSNFHYVLQFAMGWTNSHMHQFVAGGQFYGEPDRDFESHVVDERNVRLDRLLKRENDAITYEYDFGDGWEHKIELEKIQRFDPEASLPVCVAGRLACPPEDVGGIWGYQDFLRAVQDPSQAGHSEYLEWVGGEFDPRYFNLKEVNELLSEYCR